jgi:drug/metabolite transporter (DMT)-like permease
MGIEERVIEAPRLAAEYAQVSEKKLEQTFLVTPSCRWQVAFVAAALMVVCGHLMIKAGLTALPVPAGATPSLWIRLEQISLQPLVIMGLAIYGFGTLCWMAAVAQTEISLLYPLTSLNYILIALLSAFLFQETISWRRGSGLALIALGMVLLTRSQRRKQT